MKDKIAVVVPVYNVENFLERGIDCLLNQSLKELKIVCVNDATQDNSGAILNEYAKKDDRIVVLNHDINKGAGGARNTGLDYILVLYLKWNLLLFLMQMINWLKMLMKLLTMKQRNLA